MSDTPSLQAARDADYAAWREAMLKWQRDCEQHVTLRDTFAAAALTGLLANANTDEDPTTWNTPSDIAYTAYEMADAMLLERGKTPAADHENDEKRAVWHTNHDAVPAAIAPADSHAPRGAVDRDSDGTDKAEPLTRDCGTGDISEVQIDALEFVVEEGRIVNMSVYGHLRSLLVRLRPEWESDRPKPVKDDVSDRSKPISDERLAALEQLSALDQELEARHGLQGNPMIKAQRNNESM